jgi:hypothetical protein
VIHPFGLHDIWLVRRLQRSGMTLAVEHMLTHPHQPLWTALTAPWPWAGVGVASYVLNENVHGQCLQGFAQLLKRASRPEADLLHVAPAMDAPFGEASSSSSGDGLLGKLSAGEGDCPGSVRATADNRVTGRSAEAIWSRLLGHCSFAASTHGLQRIYASTPQDCPEQTSLKQAGFCLYTRETIYRLATVPSAAAAATGMRPQHPRDSWSLQRLYARSTPKLVQQAEGALAGDAGTPLLSWWEPNDWQGLILEPAGEVRGAVQVHRGRAGHWLRVFGASELSAREVRLLVEQGLRHLDVRRPVQNTAIPVYATVRGYEDNLSGALIGFGFAPFLERARFVKHTSAVVRVTETLQAPVREMAHEIGVHSRPSDGRGLKDLSGGF